MKIKKIILFPIILISIFIVYGISNLSNEKSPIQFTSPTITSVFPTIPSPTSIPQTTSFSFAVISDIHSDLPSLRRSLDKIKNDKMDFIIVAGDLTSLGRLNELQNAKETLDESGIKYYVIPGNHDLWSIKTGNNPYKDVFGKDYFTFNRGIIKYILINNGDGVIGIDETQKVWLDKELSDCPKLYCLVFAHMPLNNNFNSHIMGEDTPEVAGQATDLIKVFNKYKVKELFAGHIHYITEYTLDGLTTYTDGVIYTKNNTTTARFVEVNVKMPEITLEKKEVWIKE